MSAIALTRGWRSEAMAAAVGMRSPGWWPKGTLFADRARFWQSWRAVLAWTFVALRLAGSQNIPFVSKRQLETFLQRGSVEWLGKIGDCSPLCYPVTSPAAGKCRNEDNGDFYAAFYEIFLELRPGHSAHLHVSYQTPCPVDKRRAQECFARFKGFDVKSERLHQPACCHADAIIIINNWYQWNQSQDNPPLVGTTSLLFAMAEVCAATQSGFRCGYQPNKGADYRFD
jgi:hypothetical protein